MADSASTCPNPQLPLVCVIALQRLFLTVDVARLTREIEIPQQQIAELEGVPFTRLGKVTADKQIVIDEQSWGYLAEWQEAYDTAIGKML